MPRSKQVTRTFQEIDIKDSQLVVRFNHERAGLDVSLRYTIRDENKQIAEQGEEFVNLSAQDHTDLQAIILRALGSLMDNKGFGA